MLLEEACAHQKPRLACGSHTWATPSILRHPPIRIRGADVPSAADLGRQEFHRGPKASARRRATPRRLIDHLPASSCSRSTSGCVQNRIPCPVTYDLALASGSDARARFDLRARSPANARLSSRWRTSRYKQIITRKSPEVLALTKSPWNRATQLASAVQPPALRTHPGDIDLVVARLDLRSTAGIVGPLAFTVDSTRQQPEGLA